jgi:hypothetical protein
VTGEVVPWDKEPDLDDGVVAGESQAGDDDDETELSQIADSVENIITCLMRLSVTIRNPEPHDRYKRSAYTDASHFVPFDVEHVRARFPGSSDALARKLGVANSQR